ncbi:hypothetical protein SCHPADRAFT_503050 [Schizopora paradoxa]|uniref:Uncharacterized protein n=1 Tax=Schizopora paradoxa TaxID=27342 RepID=A0A0H2RFX9_9AGAM|nr:hypothetical protein SCHPADRAFT_503050 [Schizopora paradoxa]
MEFKFWVEKFVQGTPSQQVSSQPKKGRYRKRQGVRNVTLKGVAAKLRNEWYHELTESGTAASIKKGERDEILTKIHETDPWYGRDALNSWIFAQRKRARDKEKTCSRKLNSSCSSGRASNELEDDSKTTDLPPQAECVVTELDDESEDTESSPSILAENKTAGEHVPIETRIKSSDFHTVLLQISPGNIEELQAIAEYCGMRVEALIQYHSRIVCNARVKAKESQILQPSN